MKEKKISKSEYFKECYETMEESIDQQNILFNKLSDEATMKVAERDMALATLKRMKGSLITFQRLIDKYKEEEK